MKKHPIVVQPELVEYFGSMSRAAIYGLISYWTDFNKQQNQNYHEGRYWTYMTLDSMCNYTGLSLSSVRRQLKNLEDEGYIISGNFNKIGFDRTKWYSPSAKTITYDMPELATPSVHNEQMDVSIMSTSDVLKMSRPIPEKQEKKQIEQSTEPSLSPFNTLMKLFGEDPKFAGANRREWDKLTEWEKQQSVLKAEEYLKFDNRKKKSLRFYLIDRKWELDLTTPTETDNIENNNWVI